MEMILLDWTRMGKLYCLAGAVSERGGWRFVRPLLAGFKNCAVRNVGWSPYLLEGHTRWEVFELVKPEPATPQAPHLEDHWVLGMRSRQTLATVPLRRTILEAGVRPAGAPLFGVRLSATKTAAYLQPGTGERSLVTFLVEASQIAFSAARREGAEEFDFRVTLNVPGLNQRSLAVKDHCLLQRAEQAGAELGVRLEALRHAVAQMAPRIAVRLGVSRSFDPKDKEARCTGRCWLMADGFFSLDNPQP